MEEQINISMPLVAEIFYLLNVSVLLVSFVSKAKKPTAEEVKKKKEYYTKKEKKAAEVKKK